MQNFVARCSLTGWILGVLNQILFRNVRKNMHFTEKIELKVSDHLLGQSNRNVAFHFLTNSPDLRVWFVMIDL